ncbi:MAG: ABC transporter permease [Candidatus Latescibacteria bacterium]|nr:ABC transporter permease [Candidatus Latescibacterota bacterium]
MNSLIQEMKASMAFVERNFNLAKRYAHMEAVFVIWNVVHALTIGLIGKFMGGDDPAKVQHYVLFLIVGAVFWNFLRLLFFETADAVAWERWEGTIEYTFMAPIYRLTHLVGQCLYAVIYGILRAFLVLVLTILFFDLRFQAANLGLVGLVLAVGGFSFLGLGLMAATFPLIAPEKGAQATDIIGTFIALVSGIYYEVSVLPDWLRPLSVISPGTYALRSIRAVLLKGATLADIWGDLVILMITGIALVPIGLWVFQRAEMHAKRTGKLKRSG